MSRGYYGIINDTIYEMIANEHNLRGITYAPRNAGSVSSRCFGSARYDILVNLSNLTENALSNQEVVKNAIAKLETDKTTEITGLNNDYSKMIVNYRLISGTIDSPKAVVDEGAIVQHTGLKPVLFPLGLTDDNEYVSRWALSTGAVTFKRNYVQSAPIGISRHRESNYVLVIDRISLVQQKYTDIHERDEHPSIAYYNEPYPLTNDFVVLYDTATEGIQIDPIYFDTAPSEFSLHIAIDMNDYFVVADRTDITSVLDKNAEANKPSGDDGSTGTLDPDHKDDKSDIDSEHGGNSKPDTPGSDSSETPTPSESESKSDSSDKSESNTDTSQSESTKDSTSESNASTSETAPSESTDHSESDASKDDSQGSTTDDKNNSQSASDTAEPAPSTSESQSQSNSETSTSETKPSESQSTSESKSESDTTTTPPTGDTTGDHSASEDDAAEHA